MFFLSCWHCLLKGDVGVSAADETHALEYDSPEAVSSLADRGIFFYELIGSLYSTNLWSLKTLTLSNLISARFYGKIMYTQVNEYIQFWSPKLFFSTFCWLPWSNSRWKSQNRCGKPILKMSVHGLDTIMGCDLSANPPGSLRFMRLFPSGN